jgi:copper chaperone CopZ
MLLAVVAGCSSADSGEPAAALARLSLHVDGMMCADSCAKTVEEILAAQPGVREVQVSFEASQAICHVDPELFEPDIAIAELADQDFTARVDK